MTTTKSYQELVKNVRQTYATGRTRSVEFRREQLSALQKLLEDNEDAIVEALQLDLHKPMQETILFEIMTVLNDVKYFLRHIKDVLKPECGRRLPINWFHTVQIYKDPYGVVLLMGAWNYPFLLVLQPLAGAIAAGNCVIIKPSHLSTKSGAVMANLLGQYLDTSCYPVVLGGIEDSTALLKERYDFIVYTGSVEVARIIHKAANKYLTPTLLELGGKCPTYIDANINNMNLVAKRILWGKFINCGQTCAAPDYILCTAEVQKQFVEEAQNVIRDFFGREPDKSDSYGRIVSDRQFGRLIRLMKTGRIVIGGGSDAKQLYIEPTVIADVGGDDAIMQEEIFGPILPIVTVQNVEEAINFINGREKPLAMYVFSANKNVVKTFLEQTSSGGVTVNDTIMHAGVVHLPFGGVGLSGMGYYHGKWSIETFTHKKSVLRTPLTRPMEKLIGVRYPPYCNRKIALLRTTGYLTKGLPCRYLTHFIMFLLGVLVTLGLIFIIAIYM